MLYCPDRRFLFVQLPHTGVKRIQKALAPFINGENESVDESVDEGGFLDSLKGGFESLTQRLRVSHSNGLATAAKAKAWIPEEQYSSLYRFSFVRNPWDLLVSQYNRIRETPTHRLFGRVTGISFEKFIEYAAGKRIGFQLDRLCDGHGRLLVDYIGRYESLEKDFVEVQRQLKIIAPVDPPANKVKMDFRKYYCPATVSLVSRIYASDIEAFKYSFEPGHLRGDSRESYTDRVARRKSA